MKKTSLIILALLLTLGLANMSFAAGQWYTCNVLSVGYDSSNLPFAQLTEVNKQFENKYFQLDSGYVNQQLAIFLTALASDCKVSVYVDVAGGGDYPNVQGVYVANP